MFDSSLDTGTHRPSPFLATTLSHHPAVTVEEAPAFESDGSVIDVARLTSALIQKFEELTMIHQFTEQLRIDVERVAVCRELIGPLSHCINAVSLAIELFPDDTVGYVTEVIQTGEARKPSWLMLMADEAQRLRGEDFAIINQPFVQGDDTRRILVVPICRGDYRAGRMIAIGNNVAEEFGTIEAELMRSTAMMLAVHLTNQRQYIELQQTLDGTLVAFVSALDAKDRYTCGHSSRVAELSVALAKDLNHNQGVCETLRKAALLHDIGKIGIEDSVLRKPSELTPEEFEIVKKHPVIGYEILKTIGPFAPLLPGVLHHHEAWDGSGYPHGLIGESIPRLAQIIAVADSFDAMTSDRPYRDGMPLERVLGIFKRGSGKQWAPDVATLLVTQIDTMFKLVKSNRN